MITNDQLNDNIKTLAEDILEHLRDGSQSVDAPPQIIFDFVPTDKVKPIPGKNYSRGVFVCVDGFHSPRDEHSQMEASGRMLAEKGIDLIAAYLVANAKAINTDDEDLANRLLNHEIPFESVPHKIILGIMGVAPDKRSGCAMVDIVFNEDGKPSPQGELNIVPVAPDIEVEPGSLGVFLDAYFDARSHRNDDLFTGLERLNDML